MIAMIVATTGENEQQSRPPRDNQQRNSRDDNRNENDSSDAQEEKKPVRARRPRKVADKPVNGDASESNGLDASALPPAISISDDAEVEVGEKARTEKTGGEAKDRRSQNSRRRRGLA